MPTPASTTNASPATTGQKAQLLGRLVTAIETTKTSERHNRVWMDTRDWCGTIKALAIEAREILNANLNS